MIAVTLEELESKKKFFQYILSRRVNEYFENNIKTDETYQLLCSKMNVDNKTILIYYSSVDNNNEVKYDDFKITIEELLNENC